MAALSLTAVLCVALGAPSVVRVPSVLGFLCIAPGAAFVIAVGGHREPGLIVGLSLAAVAVVAQVMLWLGAWSPVAFFYALAAACLLALASAAERFPTAATVNGRVLSRRVQPLDDWALGLRVRSLIGRLSRRAAVHAGVLAGALILWVLALAGAQLGRMAGLGLLDALPVTYFIAFALLLGGFAFAAGSSDLNPRLLGAYVFVLILLLHGTTAILYNEPRYAWVYKHIGVINLIGATGHADHQIDIYNNWPAFFAANAWLSRTAGIAPIAYAGWAQVFFNIVDVVAFRFALRGFTREERLLWTAALFFVVGNWVGQDYLAPQAFSFSVSLVVLGLVIRSGRSPKGGLLNRKWRARSGTVSTLRRRSLTRADTPAPPPLSPPAALTAGGVCVLAVVITHQLSPLMLIADVAAIALVARRTPLWIPAAMAAIEVWWLLLAWPFLSSHFSLFDLGGGTGTGVTRNLSVALPGARLTFYAPAVLMAMMFILAVPGAVRRRRDGKRNTVLGCLIAAPVAVVGFQSYGGEGPYRAFLFALPWLAFLAASACLDSPLRTRTSRMRAARLLFATSAVGAYLLVAYFGQELVNHIPSDDVQAATWYELHAPAGALRIDLAPNAPDRLTARYPLVSLADPSTLLTLPEFTGHRLGARDLPHLDAYIQSHEAYADGRGSHPVYVVLTRAQENYGRLNGLIPSGSVAGLTAALKRSPYFHLVFSRPTAWIFRYEPASLQSHPRTRS